MADTEYTESTEKRLKIDSFFLCGFVGLFSVCSVTSEAKVFYDPHLPRL